MKKKHGQKGREDNMAIGFEPDEIWITEITVDNAIEFCEKIKRRFNENPQIPIPIYINSPGGDVSAMFTMMHAMDSIRAIAPPNFYFITIVTGEACSAAADILAHGDIRIALPYSTIMIHQTSGGAAGHIEDLKSSIKEHDRINDLSAKIFVHNTNIPGGVSGYKKIAARDKYLSPEEAKDLGIVDHVGRVNFELVQVLRVMITDSSPANKNPDAAKFVQLIENETVEQTEKPKRKRKVKEEKGE